MLRASGMDWTPAACFAPRISPKTWDTLKGDAANQRLLRLTEKGRRAAEGTRRLSLDALRAKRFLGTSPLRSGAYFFGDFKR